MSRRRTSRSFAKKMARRNDLGDAGASTTVRPLFRPRTKLSYDNPGVVPGKEPGGRVQPLALPWTTRSNQLFGVQSSTPDFMCADPSHRRPAGCAQTTRPSPSTGPSGPQVRPAPGGAPVCASRRAIVPPKFVHRAGVAGRNGAPSFAVPGGARIFSITNLRTKLARGGRGCRSVGSGAPKLLGGMRRSGPIEAQACYRAYGRLDRLFRAACSRKSPQDYLACGKLAGW